MDSTLAAAAVGGLSLTLSVSIYGFARLRIEQERTLQKLIERGASGDELIRAAGSRNKGSKDLRRGLLFIAVGLLREGVRGQGSGVGGTGIRG